jgi:hypothetical protein
MKDSMGKIKVAVEQAKSSMTRLNFGVHLNEYDS